MKRKWILGTASLALGVLATGMAIAAETTTREMSLEDCIQGALEKNLDLRIARYTIPQSQLDLKAAYAGYDPNFSISGDHNFSLSGGGYNPSIGLPSPATTSDQDTFSSSLSGLSPWGLTYNLSGNVAESYGHSGANAFDSSRGSATLSLTQPLLKNFWIDGTRLNIRVAKNRLKWTDLGLKQSVMSTATAVEQAYYDLIYARELVRVQEKAVELAQRLLAENKKRVEVGALAPLDEKQAESQAASSEADLISVKNSLAMQQNTLKQLLSDNFTAWEATELKPTATLAAPVRVFDLQNSWNKGLTQRPDLQQAKLDLERQGITLKYNYNQLFPELDLVGSYGHGASGSDVREFSDAFDSLRQGNRPNYSYGAQLVIPLGNTGARATYKKSKLTMETLVLTLKKAEQSIMITIDNDIKQAQSSYQRVAATRKAREYAEDALAAEQKKLENGKSTTYTVLQMQRDLTSASGSEIQALATYNKALAQLSLDEGTTLERLRIDVSVK